MPSLVSHQLSIIKYVVLKKIFFFLCFDRLIWTWTWTWTRTSLDSDLTRTRTSLDLDLTRTRTSLDLDLSWTRQRWTWLQPYSKLKPEPGPYPRLSDPTRPDPSGTVKFRARTRPDPRSPPQRNRLIKALPFLKHLPVMTVCEHQVQRSHTFCQVYEFCMDKKKILPPYKLWSFFVS